MLYDLFIQGLLYEVFIQGLLYDQICYMRVSWEQGTLTCVCAYTCAGAVRI